MAGTKKILDALEKTLGRALPPRYRLFAEGTQIKDYRGLWCAGLPGYDPKAAFKVKFPEPGFSLFEEQEVERKNHPDHLPLCSLDKEPQFLAVKLDPDCPVEMWEHETGQFRPYAPSLDAFLKMLSVAKPETTAAASAAPPPPNKEDDKGPLLNAIKQGDLDGIRKAVAAGADVNAKRGSTAVTPLHAALMNSGLPGATYDAMAFLLIELGADLHAKDSDDNDAREYTSSSLAKKLEAAFLAKRGSAPVALSEFVVWEAARVPKAFALDLPKGVTSSDLLKGKTFGSKFPKKVYFPARKDYEDWKQDIQLIDCFESQHVPVISSRMKTFLAAKKLAQVEFLPVAIHDHTDKPAAWDYFAVNPPAYDCLDVEKSGAELNPLDKKTVMSFHRVVLRMDKIPASALLFRVEGERSLLLLRRALAEDIAAQNFSGFATKEPRR
jgi:hypothetical protein